MIEFQNKAIRQWLSLCLALMFLTNCAKGTENHIPLGRILYVKKLSESNEGVYSMDADGNNIERLTPSAVIAPPIIAPVFSPVNEHIAFGCNAKGIAHNICIMEKAGLWPQPIAPYQSYRSPDVVFAQEEIGCSDFHIDSVTWASDGTQLAFVCSLPSSEEKQTCIVSLDGVGTCWSLTDITHGDKPDGQVHIAWDPTKDRLAISVQSKIYLIDIDGTNNIFITKGKNPDWSPDGQRLVFFPNDSQLSIIYLDTGVLESVYQSPHPARITDIDKTPLLHNNSVATWSPDGAFIAFTAHLGGWSDSSDAIYVLDLVKMSVRRITTLDDGGYKTLDWMP